MASISNALENLCENSLKNEQEFSFQQITSGPLEPRADYTMNVTHSSRSAMARSQLFLRLASECTADRRIEFEAFLEASIVFARASMHRLQRRHRDHPNWKAWWANLGTNASVQFFRTQRDWLLKEAPPKIGQRAFVRSLVVGAGRSSEPLGYEPTKAAEFYFFDEPDTLATDTVERHLAELERLFKEANALFLPVASLSPPTD